MKLTSLAFTVLAAAVVPAFASGERSQSLPNGAVLSADGSRVTFTQPTYIRAEKPEARPQALVRLFDNFAEKYPDAVVIP